MRLAKICELQGVPTDLQGHDLTPLLINPQAQWDHVAYSVLLRTHNKFIKYMKPGERAMGRSVRDERFRYIEWDEGKKGGELYNDGLYEDILHLMEAFDASAFTRRIICLMQMLDLLCSCKEYRLLSETPYNMANHLEGGTEPVDKVYTYLYNHFKEDVRLENIAGYVGQNPTALCRYFKQCARKSIFRCLAEIRIGHSAKLLAYSNLPVSQIAFDSGYNTMSHFISQFKMLMGRTPSEYREQIRK